MDIGKLLKYLLGGIIAWVVLSTVVSVVFSALAVLWSLLVTAVSVLVLAAVVYGLYSLYRSVSGSDIDTRTRTRTGTRTGTSEAPPDGSSAAERPVERLKREYAEGKLSEQEFERRLETELDDSNELDRELQ